MTLEQNKKNWVSIDNQIKEINERAKELRESRSNLENSITQYIEENELTDATIEISDGKLRYARYKNAQPLTLKYVDKCLKEIIPNPEQVDKIMQYIKSKREEKIAPIIKRYYNN